MASTPAGSQQVEKGKKGNQSQESGCAVAERYENSLGWGPAGGAHGMVAGEPSWSTALPEGWQEMSQGQGEESLPGV